MTNEELKSLVEQVKDQDSLVELLQKGLGWKLHPEFQFDDTPEIAKDVKGTKCQTYHLVGDFEGKEVFLVEFEAEYVRRDLRELLTSLRKLIKDTAKFSGTEGYGDAIFIVTTPGYEDIRFVLFEHQDKRLPRIKSFGWRKKFAGRTVLTHNLARLRWDDQTYWGEAWNVEALTDRFYDDLEGCFETIREKTKHPIPESTHAYAQTLVNRLLFIAFVERFEWLKTPEGNSDYLFALYNRKRDKSFLELLELLFFSGLDSPNGIGGKDALFPILGEVPYLNGGLFSRDPDLDRAGIKIPDEAFAVLLDEKTGLFRKYNFTVTESTPLDQEVAVDPEMLGKIFERLIIAEERHKTGTYYTPRPIVEFMVNEALKSYLVRRGLAKEKAALLVDEDKVESDDLNFKPTELQNTVDWLYEVRAVDPACGSGAYLLMLLQRIFELVDRVTVIQGKGRNLDPHHFYDTKLKILQRSIYGVDLSEVAVRIARLRLWLSLVVENKGTKPEPLPNFDFLIIHGDALCSPLGLDGRTLYYPHDEIDAYAKLKRRFFHPEPGESKPTKDEMKAAKQKITDVFSESIASSKLRSLSKAPFDWEVEFAEVFDPKESEGTLGGHLNMGGHVSKTGQAELPQASARGRGFDIVLANPPYVNSGELKRSVGPEYKAEWVKAYPNSATGTADLLVSFMDRALQLLCPGGVLAFITSNKWLRAGYGAKLRAHLAKEASVHHLIDFGELPVFQTVSTFPLITVATKGQFDGVAVFTNVLNLDSPYPDVSEVIRNSGIELEPDAIKGEDWKLSTSKTRSKLDQIRSRGVPLGKYANEQIYRGLLTGLNEAFVINEETRDRLITQDPKSNEIIKPVAAGKDVLKWKIRDSRRWMIVTPIDVDISRYPAVMAHLKQFQEKLEVRGDKGNHWWELRACAYYDKFYSPKIAITKAAISPDFAFDDQGLVLLNTAYLLPVRDRKLSLYLLAILNSSTITNYIREIVVTLGDPEKRGRVEPRQSDLMQIPIIDANTEDRKALEILVGKILDQKSASSNNDVNRLETEINERVEFLYFHQTGDETYDEWRVRRDAEEGTIVGEVRKMIEVDENDTVEFKETLEFVDRPPAGLTGDALNQWRVKAQQVRVHEVLKTICGFINNAGGTLLIGVSNSRVAIGIEPDYKLLSNPKDQGIDGFERKVRDLCDKRFNRRPIGLLTFRFVPIDGKMVCRVDVQPNKEPFYLDKEYWVRDGNRTITLIDHERDEWIANRK